MVKLVIADDNYNYVMSLTQYLLEKHGQVFEIASFTQGEVMEEYLSTSDGVDILLLARTLRNVSKEYNGVKQVIELTDTCGENIPTSIYKFQRADDIAKRLLDLSDRLSNGSIYMNRCGKQSRIICLYSPAGGAGKTTLAYHLAVQFPLYNQRVLYLTTESYASFTVHKSDEPTRGLGYLLYLIKNKHPNLCLKLSNIKIVDHNTNVHFLEREMNIMEYKDIRMEDMASLLEFLKNESDYDAVIIDLDSTMSDATLGLFKYCDVIVNVFDCSAMAHSKQEDFIRQLPKISDYLKADISKKMISVLNKHNEAGYIDEQTISQWSIQIMIPFISNCHISHGAYLPEIKTFKTLYEKVKNLL